jgi:hypothetical protein
LRLIRWRLIGEKSARRFIAWAHISLSNTAPSHSPAPLLGPHHDFVNCVPLSVGIIVDVIPLSQCQGLLDLTV